MWKSITLGCLIGLSVLPPLASASPSAPLRHEPRPPALMAGKTLFDEHCASCHQADGRGGTRFGHVVAANLRAPHLEAVYHHSDALIIRAILQGKDEDGERLQAPMPRWAGRLSHAQAVAIVDYLHTLH